MLKRVLIVIGATVLVLAAVALVLYNFGSMWMPSADVRRAYVAGVSAGRVSAIEQPFHIPIPGCVCHSPDPVLQVQHESRRIKDCAGCHSR